LNTTQQNIRFLRLQQHHDGTIYQLQTFCIEACPDYTALSYTWGTVTPQFSILVDGKSLIVRRNLFRFLEQYRPGENTYLWVDQICIGTLRGQKLLLR
jgi:hypothetical protein